MALSGVHVAFGFARNRTDSVPHATLVYRATSAQTMSSPGTSTVSAASASSTDLMSTLTVSVSAPTFFVVGPAPDINAGPRRYLESGSVDLYVDAGDRVAWTTA